MGGKFFARDRKLYVYGGKYYRATSGAKLEEIYREIGELEATEIKSDVHVDYSERFAYFLWPGCRCSAWQDCRDSWRHVGSLSLIHI